MREDLRNAEVDRDEAKKRTNEIDKEVRNRMFISSPFLFVFVSSVLTLPLLLSSPLLSSSLLFSSLLSLLFILLFLFFLHLPFLPSYPLSSLKLFATKPQNFAFVSPLSPLSFNILSSTILSPSPKRIAKYLISTNRSTRLSCRMRSCCLRRMNVWCLFAQSSRR